MRVGNVNYIVAYGGVPSFQEVLNNALKAQRTTDEVIKKVDRESSYRSFVSNKSKSQKGRLFDGRA